MDPETESTRLQPRHGLVFSDRELSRGGAGTRSSIHDRCGTTVNAKKLWRDETITSHTVRRKAVVSFLNYFIKLFFFWDFENAILRARCMCGRCAMRAITYMRPHASRSDDLVCGHRGFLCIL